MFSRCSATPAGTIGSGLKFKPHTKKHHTHRMTRTPLFPVR